MRGWTAGAAGLAAMAMAADAAAGSATFKDWTAVCDNTRSCEAFGFSDWSDGEVLAHLRVRRAAAAMAAAEVDILLPEFTAGAAVEARVDGKPLMTLTVIQETRQENGETYEAERHAPLTTAQAAALLDALRAGERLQLADGEHKATVSLSGAQAALRWVDDQQKRVGTVTALAAKGDKGAQAVPAPPPPPVVATGKVVSQAGLPKSTPKAVRALFSDCEKVSEDMQDDIVARLSPGRILWGRVCQVAAYNVVYRFVLSGEGGAQPHPLVLTGDGLNSDDGSLVNASFDLASLSLSEFAKYRGLADCGSADSWVWDGRAFVLVERLNMEECRGLQPDYWPRRWTAEVR